MASQGKGLDPEQAFALAMGQNSDKMDKPHMGSLRIRMREHNLSRRRKVSVTDLGPMTTVHEAAIDSRRADDSPKSRTPYTPLSGSQGASSPMSGMTQSSTLTASTLPTPVSATTDSRASPKQWKSEVNPAALHTYKEKPVDIAQSMNMPRPSVEAKPPTSSTRHHRRNMSESSSITDRGRPRKLSDASTLKRSESKRSKSAERRAFESLPKGWKAPDAIQMLEQSEINALQKQAAQQAARFEIMRKEDVDILSKELRNLDERAEYLRRTYHSLRAGRRNVHSRICQYLRSPRVAKFSHEPMLKQEEALAELDASIDEWVNKLEQAENRRTRIRQKLLEHVAAVMALPASGIVGASESLQLAMGVAHSSIPINLATPPRSPTKIAFTPPARSSSPPPQRFIAQIPSTILEQPVVEEAASFGSRIGQPEEQQRTADGKKNQEADEPLTADIERAAVESIRIYAGDEVAALLVDVEQQMMRMSKAADHATAAKETDGNMSDEERRELHRAHSQEVLQGGSPTTSSDASLDTAVSAAGTARSSPSTSATRTATPTTSEASEQAPGEFLLTSAVFNPKTAVAQ